MVEVFGASPKFRAMTSRKSIGNFATYKLCNSRHSIFEADFMRSFTIMRRLSRDVNTTYFGLKSELFRKNQVTEKKKNL
jgi:hypothetical protein